ncbi:hypothetical protein BRARA_I03911 [Brassica rapa]|uniref:Serine-threonine/tyrosine-protein kinase catalytic domain-containing protein n=1 Tax=Brassica campestris TaxID=3711 RepID=A0A397Y107_BRACM|nr:hypothetical protein BRARA_I03911 [Brassica rapa]
MLCSRGSIDETTLTPTRSITEINYLVQLSHPNLFKLIGYCLEDEQLLLLYEFMHKES